MTKVQPTPPPPPPGRRVLITGIIPPRRPRPEPDYIPLRARAWDDDSETFSRRRAPQEAL